ncbi:hypothetical protein F2Q69_00049906 [Brassica cretica]|uniref:Uncharacterized protein n=1 Tax=Brassica cretica TaxID=69181 RepID=A0A8S9PIF2_BRACR|nr:hypothetical protein F2Q69_00049906 [Brassica cretica]
MIYSKKVKKRVGTGKEESRRNPRALLTRIAARRGAKEKCDDSDKEERRGEQLD